MFSKLIVGCLAAASVEAAAPATLHLPVQRSRLHNTLSKRNDTVQASLANQLQLYTIEVEIGTPPQKTLVSLDSGSSELWVNPNCSSVPAEFGQREICELAPFVNITKSSSAKASSISTNITYGSLGEIPTAVNLDMYLDTVSIGGTQIKSQRLGIPSKVIELTAGIMGIGPSPRGWELNATYPILLDNMAVSKVINSRAYGLALGPLDSAQGSIVFGGMDVKKFTGKLASQPIVESVDGQPRLTINYKSLSIASGDRHKEFKVESSNVLVDSGNTFTKLQGDLVQELWDTVGAKLDESIGFPVVDCKVKKMPGGLTFGFDGVDVVVSFDDLVYQVDDTCLFGIVKTIGQDQQILGDTFMRSAYVVVDMDNKNIHLAQYQDCGSEIVSIGAGPEAVPDVHGHCGRHEKDMPATGPRPMGDVKTSSGSLLTPTGVTFVAGMISMVLGQSWM